MFDTLDWSMIGVVAVVYVMCTLESILKRTKENKFIDSDNEQVLSDLVKQEKLRVENEDLKQQLERERLRWAGEIQGNHRTIKRLEEYNKKLGTQLVETCDEIEALKETKTKLAPILSSTIDVAEQEINKLRTALDETKKIQAANKRLVEENKQLAKLVKQHEAQLKIINADAASMATAIAAIHAEKVSNPGRDIFPTQ